MSQLHSETRGQFRWLQTVECDEGLTLLTAHAELPTGIIVERVAGADEPIVFVTDLTGCEITLTPRQAAELGVALFELPVP